MTRSPIPLTKEYNLGRLGSGGDEIAMSARGDELKELAHWAGVLSVESFSATIGLQRVSSTRFNYDAELKATLVQECVVTLKPVRSVLNRKVHREIHLAEPSRLPADGEVVVDPQSDDDDVREEIPSLHYDLAGPLLEELVLAVDPYPRSQGVAFTPPQEPEDRPQSPFSVLKNLKNPG
jgi:hypothetical protein